METLFGNIYQMVTCTHHTFPSHVSSTQADVAREMLRNIPDGAMHIITDGEFAGTDLVRLSSDVHRPSFKEWGPIKKHTYVNSRYSPPTNLYFA
jgi:hypothetical protein